MTDKLLILDIDETLIHSDVLEPDFYDFMVLNKYYTIKRPTQLETGNILIGTSIK